MTRLYVSNLNYETSESDLREVFLRYGDVVYCGIVHDKATLRSRGFAFVEMVSPIHAREAIIGLSGAELDGRALKVELARERQSTTAPQYARRRA